MATLLPVSIAVSRARQAEETGITDGVLGVRLFNSKPASAMNGLNVEPGGIDLSALDY